MNLPHHQLIVATALVMVRVRSSEDIVSNVRTDVARLVVPLDVGGHALNLSHVQASRELLANVGIALHIILTTLPVPGCRPSDARAGGAVDCCALATRAGGSFAPVVIVELVSIGCVVLVLPAKLCSLTSREIG